MNTRRHNGAQIPRREPSNREALAEQKRLTERNIEQLVSTDGHFVARSKKGSTSEWIFYRADEGYTRPKRIRVGQLTTRNKDVVRAVLDLLADFGAREVL